MAVTFLEYDLVGVFAHGPFAGNQLAVVHNAAALPDSALISIAQEFNLPETTFPTPIENPTPILARCPSRHS